jgi:glycosyltransferase involved in cell wall biosynthesis
MPLVTVLTPTYNRAHTLPRLYESLVAQSFRDFEWLIVDDGSEDNTGVLVRSWLETGEMEIRLHRQSNHGMHFAVNRGVEMARGEFIALVGSDDWFVPEAFERMVRHWNDIPVSEQARFAGVVGLCATEDGRIIGDRFPADVFDSDPVELHYVHGVSGDKQGMLRRDVWQEFPFPYEDLHGLVPDALVWNRMAQKYRERYVNEVYLVKGYEAGGLTSRTLELQVRAAPASRQFFLEEAMLPHTLRRSRRIRALANYARFSFHSRISLRGQLNDAPSRAAWLMLLPLGFGLYLRDRWRLR